MTPIEAALGFAIVGSLLAVAVPAFFRDLRSSKFVEPVSGLNALAASATTYARAHDVAHAYPGSAPLTPSVVPRGKGAVDPPGAWDQPTWKALAFRPAPEGVAHEFAFAFDSALGASRSSFVATSHGDLDGDGVTSTFEVRGHDATGVGPAVEPGMRIEAEVE